jgi:hypothetical protein
MTAKDDLINLYIIENQHLRKKVLEFAEELKDKEIIIKLLKNKNKAYDKYN